MHGIKPLLRDLLIPILLLSGFSTSAQLPVCSGPGSGLVYYLSGTQIWNWDPAQPFSTSNPWPNTLPGPPGAIGLAVSDNINGPGPSPTFYAVDGQFYYYWDGTTWVNTNHTAGAVNPGAGGGFIYSLIGSSGQIYKYDGTGNAPLLITIPDFNGEGPYDLVGDCEGNFYILNTTANWLRKYNSSGTLVQTWTTSGGQLGSAGGGMAIIGNMVYYDGTGGLWSGPMVGSTITFTNINSSLGPSDFASCSIGGSGPITGNSDTFYYCGTGPGVELVSSGQESDTITWTVQSGNAVITGSGDTVTVTATTTAVVYSTTTTVCGMTQDTFKIVVPTATVSAGNDDNVFGCGVFHDTLQGSVTGLTSGVTYNYTWTPGGSVISGGNSLTPIVDAGSSTQFVLTVVTTQGGCTWTDTVDLTTVDVNVIAGFTSEIRFGCEEDTVILFNNSQFATNFFWDFGDGSPIDTSASPTHIYTTQGNYLIKLVVTNISCADSMTIAHDLNHPLDAQFTVDNPNICQGQQVTFTNTSVATFVNGVAPTYYWEFGDGTSSTSAGPVHVYTSPGTYVIRLVVGNAVPCWDTTTATVVVDSQSTVEVTLSDSMICAGEKVFLVSEFLDEGLTSYTWNMGDGILITDQAPASHTFEYPGTYSISLSVDYTVCNDAQDAKTVIVQPQPVITLGEDTSFCPNAGAMPLQDIINIGNPSASWLWNTGETGGSIAVSSPGTYFARVTVNECSATDSITIWKDCYLDVPNAFSPDGDNLNDLFLPRQLLSKSVTAYKMIVYNRWGQEVFSTTNVNGRGWDGRFNGEPQPQGVYVYTIEVTFADNRSEKKQGNVTLLR